MVLAKDAGRSLFTLFEMVKSIWGFSPTGFSVQPFLLTPILISFKVGTQVFDLCPWGRG